MGDILAQGRAAVAGQPYFEGRKNAYECDGEDAFNGKASKPGCSAFIVTVDVAAGVTPFMLKCGRCGGYAHSKFYRVADWLEPTHEWYRPDNLDGIDPAYHEHLSRGGLILRPVEGGQDVWLRPDDAPDKHSLVRRHEEMLAKFRTARVESEKSRLMSAQLVETELTKQPMRKELPPGLSRQQRRHLKRKGPSS